MPFQKGHKLSVGNVGGGRKGYKFEEQHMERMKKLLDQYLIFMEKDVLTKKEQERLRTIERFTLKILDKMFPNKLAVKEETELTINEPPRLSPSIEASINKIYGEKYKNLDKVWSYLGNEEKFKNYIETEVESFLKAR